MAPVVRTWPELAIGIGPNVPGFAALLDEALALLNGKFRGRPVHRELVAIRSKRGFLIGLTLVYS